MIAAPLVVAGYALIAVAMTIVCIVVADRLPRGLELETQLAVSMLWPVALLVVAAVVFWRGACRAFSYQWIPRAQAVYRRTWFDVLRVCDCGALPDPSEKPTTGNYTENGIEKYICLRCWERENGSDPSADAAPPRCRSTTSRWHS